MLIIHSPRCLDYAAPGHPETPERVRSSVARLQARGYHHWLTPAPCDEADILRVHSPGVLEAARTGDYFDTDTPFFPQTFELAKLAAGAAILAADKALAGEPAFSLMRPPGHHAERNRIMGFCYFNNIAIAVAKVLAGGDKIQKVAILDFDCHHGNGTEDVFRGNERVLFASLHQSPCYPGTGARSDQNCLNYPLRPETGPALFLETLTTALDTIAAFDPHLLAVSAGFDAYKNDPITEMQLEIDTYHEIGVRIKHLCRKRATAGKPLPCFAVLEGGYARDVSLCVEAYVNGWDH